MKEIAPTWLAFAGGRRIAFGAPETVALAAQSALKASPETPVLVLDAATAKPVEPDLRGGPEELLARMRAPARGPGRPKLGVAAREVTLLPRHWDWLAGQPGGASATLRRLVEQASRRGPDKDRRRAAQEAAYRLITTLAGDMPGYEEATRALFAGDRPNLRLRMAHWPPDVREEALRLAEDALD